MSEHKANIIWKRDKDDFSYKTYTRDHIWRFFGGVEIQASAAPDFLGNEELIDPEEAFTASLSSCHMLTFLAIAARKGFVVDQYNDSAIGFLEKNENGKMAVTRVELYPKIIFSGEKIPSEQEIESLHKNAHDHCFIANSVLAKVIVKNSSTAS